MTEGPDGSVSEAAIALLHTEAWLRRMIDAVPAMITYLDERERYLFCNRPYLEMLSKRADEVLGRSLRQVLGEQVHAALQPCLTQVRAGCTAHYERQHRRADGVVCDLTVTLLPYEDEAGHVAGFFSLTLDITHLKALERKLAHMAQHDPLTGLPNRALFDDRLAQAIERNRRHHEPFALLCLDVDHFKRVNDTHGHAVGDRLLRAFAVRLCACVRAVDTAARLGGDEFALILEGPITAEEAARVAEIVCGAMRPPFELGDLRLSITTSVGVAVAQDPPSADALATTADAALYQAKADGRNTCSVTIV